MHSTFQAASASAKSSQRHRGGKTRKSADASDDDQDMAVSSADEASDSGSGREGSEVEEGGTREPAHCDYIWLCVPQ